MDRRRFVPAPEGLEGRAMLSLFGHVNSRLFNNPELDVPFTFRQKELRIKRLPYYVNQLQPGRFLPKTTIDSLQGDLVAIAGNMHPVPTKVLDDFNRFLRDLLPRASLSAGNANGLNHAFGSVLTHGGATPQDVANLQSDMIALAKVDANSPNPVYLATNDYSLILESALGIGHAIKTPTAPQLALRDGTRTSLGGITANHQPTLVGVYDAGGTVDAGTVIQIVDTAGRVYGAGPVQTNGQNQTSGKYAVTFDQPLNDGKYVLHARAEVNGHVSPLSPAIELKVVTRHRGQVATQNLVPPGGPLSLK